VKARIRFYLRLPEVKPGDYVGWREAIHREIQARGDGFEFPPDWRLGLKARVYLPQERWHAIDVDNCLKSLMEALQGAVTGSGSKLAKAPIVIPNDNQVYAAAIVKAPAGPKKVGGYVIVRRVPGKHTPTGKRPGAAPPF
jgi:hypothetical protein